MAYFSGSHGALYVDSQFAADNYDNKKPIAKVKGWTLNQTTQAMDSTTLEDTDSTYEPGLRSYTGTANFFYYPTAGQDSLGSLINRSMKTRSPGKVGVAEAPKTFGFKLYMADDNPNRTNAVASGYVVQVRAIITELSVSVNTGELTGGTMSFQVIGAPETVRA